MGAIASQITRLSIVHSTVYSTADQRKHQSSASLAFVWGIHRSLVNSPHKWPATQKMFPFDDVIMEICVAESNQFSEKCICVVGPFKPIHYNVSHAQYRWFFLERNLDYCWRIAVPTRFWQTLIATQMIPRASQNFAFGTRWYCDYVNTKLVHCANRQQIPNANCLYNIENPLAGKISYLYWNWPRSLPGDYSKWPSQRHLNRITVMMPTLSSLGTGCGRYTPVATKLASWHLM